MICHIRILPNGDGLWFIAGFDPEPFTISLTDTYAEAVEEAQRFACQSGFTIVSPGQVIAFQSERGALV